MRAVLRCIALLFCTVLFFACASAPYRTNLQLPRNSKPSLLPRAEEGNNN